MLRSTDALFRHPLRLHRTIRIIAPTPHYTFPLRIVQAWSQNVFLQLNPHLALNTNPMTLSVSCILSASDGTVVSKDDLLPFYAV